MSKDMLRKLIGIAIFLAGFFVIISTVFLKSKFIPIILILIIQMFMSIYNRVFVIPNYRKSGFVIITIILISIILSIILFVSQGERIAVIFSGIIAMLVIIFEKFFINKGRL